VLCCISCVGLNCTATVPCSMAGCRYVRETLPSCTLPCPALLYHTSTPPTPLSLLRPPPPSLPPFPPSPPLPSGMQLNDSKGAPRGGEVHVQVRALVWCSLSCVLAVLRACLLCWRYLGVNPLCTCGVGLGCTTTDPAPQGWSPHRWRRSCWCVAQSTICKPKGSSRGVVCVLCLCAPRPGNLGASRL
jgi:hypothetical protein